MHVPHPGSKSCYVGKKRVVTWVQAHHATMWSTSHVETLYASERVGQLFPYRPFLDHEFLPTYRAVWRTEELITLTQPQLGLVLYQ